ncbi:TonB-dependent receptor [uncultured Abyssibacter sp.]|uniref:TonB-dependent receptor n=1 Tax=uncultured Abyssibacter sp. TaxID=2320202 RepID=UPI0032B232F8
MRRLLPVVCGTLLAGQCSGVFAAGVPTDTLELDPVVVEGEADELTGTPDSATQGVVTAAQLEARPVARPGELLEFVPGLIATQHSGEGKANQYFLRGFNLDHGTDFSTDVDGVPVNMPTHGHGQGYSDLSFMIPELIGRLDYRKGPYYADVGDFSTAGSASIRYRDRLPGPMLQVTVGEFGYYRGLAAASPKVADGHLLAGVAYTRDDGPWVLDDDLSQIQGLLRYSSGSADDGVSISAAAYDGEWRSTDQIPRRAVRSGQIDRYGFIDDSLGGDSHRYSLSAELRRPTARGHWSLDGYALDYALDLYSNFTYLLEDPADGDQFEQVDDRQVYGLGGHWHGAQLPGSGFGWLGDVDLGFDIRHDAIGTVGLYRTERRQRLSTVREDGVDQTLASVFASSSRPLRPWLRSVVGLRIDHLMVDVDATRPENSGDADDTLVSPKLSLIAGPWRDTEFFLNLGRGFHSNDARGATIRVDPNTGTAADPVDLLVAGDGVDLGLRSVLADGLYASLSLWALELDSELVFVGDGGSTEASGASERRGVEASLYYQPASWLVFDADLAVSRARFDNGDRVPNAVERVASAGISVPEWQRFGAGLRLRYLGEAPLVEDNSLRSEPTTILNAQITYRLTRTIRLRLEGFNLLDAEDNDITYYYASRLDGEPAEGVEDIHFHPVEPRMLRLGFQATF